MPADPVPARTIPACRIGAHDGLRGLAALMVVLYHLQFGPGFRLGIERASGLHRGYLMVDLFFVLSGFIISYVNPAGTFQPFVPTFRRFLVRRLIRLYPLALACLLALVAFSASLSLASWSLNRPEPIDWGPASLVQLAAQFVLLNAWLPGDGGWNVPSWSISAELAAYGLFPPLVALWQRRRWASLLLLLATPLGFYGWIAASTGVLDIVGFPAPVRCIAGFTAGMLVFHARDIAARAPFAALTMAQLAAVAGITACLVVPVNDIAIIPWLILLVGATWTDRGWLGQLLQRRGAMRLGDLSYSIYLVHVPLIAMLGAVWTRSAAHWLPEPIERVGWLLTCLMTVIVTASLSFRWIEIPARAWLTRQLLGRTAGPIAAVPAAP